MFFKLFYPLLDFVNKQKNIDDFDSIADAKAAGEDIPESLLSKASLILWQEPDLIDEYLIEKGDLLGDEEKEIVSSWKNAVIGRFVLERHLKKGSIFLSGEDNRVFLVRGLTTTWEEMFPFRPLPILLSTTLIPFRDVIVTDGIVYPHSVIIGSTMAKDFKEQYMTAKRQGAVIDALV